jgi:type II secretory ATPase GspE/PulE/Tfp pilus assembly ATPase PilB-like protein
VQSKFEYLVIDNVIAAGELDLATKAARRKNKNVEDILIDEFQVKLPAIGAALAKFFGVEYEPFKQDRIKPPDLLKNIKRDYAEGNHWIPLEDSKAGVLVMSTDPERTKSSRMVDNVFPRSKIVYKVTTERDFRLTLDQFFGAEGMAGSNESIGDLLSSLDEEEEGGFGAGADEVSAAADNELVKLVNKIIVDAYNQGASDIHVEPLPGKGKTGVRFRKDGTLTNYIEVPASYRQPLVTRLKIMCDLDISEKRRPQDGKIKFKKFGPLDIELRVATIPTAGGVEDVVMRILAAGEPIPLAKLGLTNYNYETLKKTVSKPYGLFFVCGPTGSGKTTTLHSALGSINTEDMKIWTAEDPVEITQKGLRQVQVQPKIDFTFAAAMRSFLRADPDVIMVGEMRDHETAAIGVEASLTGHLVFSTLHTNSAPETISRLLDMNIDPFNFADALLGIMAQRLIRTLCPKCKEPHHPSEEEFDELMEIYGRDFFPDLGIKYSPDFVLYEPKGCSNCNNTGYKGRMGVHELLTGTDEVKRAVQRRAPIDELRNLAMQQGMRTLLQDALEKAMRGITDVKQARSIAVK